jgi:hypothetical protein
MSDDARAAEPGRRGVLGLGLGLGGVAALGALFGAPGAAAATGAPGGGTAPQSPIAAPRTRARRLRGPGVLRPGFAVGTVAVRWTEAAPRVRPIAADGRPGPWRAVRAGCPVGTDAAGQEAPATSSALVDTAGAVAVEVAASPATEVVALEATGGATPAAAVVAGRRYLNRQAWGADESLRFDAAGNERWVPTYFPVQTLTVHHTATTNDDPDPAARMRAIYQYQAVTEGFGDFGYHLVIDESGNLYEGRWSGTDPLPGFAPDGKMVNGAHVGGYNAGNVGIALLGDFTDRDPAPAAYSTLVLVLTVLTVWHGLDPQSLTAYVNPVSGARAEVPTIAGHRDWPFPTQCPGNRFYPTLERLREDVAALRGRPG